MATIDWLLLNPEEICKMAVERAKRDKSKKDLASVEAIKRISGEQVSDFDYRVAFSVLKERDPKLMQGILLQIASEYNVMREKVLKMHPSFADMSWNVYKLVGVSFRSPSFESMYFTEPDIEFARFYARQQMNAFGRQDGFTIFESWDSFEQIGYEKDFLFGVGQFTFRDRKGHTMQTIWDLKQEKLPAFVYANKL